MIKFFTLLIKKLIPNAQEQYLESSKDIYELENRMRQIQERESRIWS